MSADTPRASTKPETWLDWLPPDSPGLGADALLTRAQVLAQLHARGVGVSESDLRFWEYEGVLPRPVRRWHQGATRALYPSFAPGFISEVPRHRRSRIPLAQIGSLIRQRGIHSLAVQAYDLQTDEGIDQYLAASRRGEYAAPTEVLINELRQLAQRRERLTGIAVDRVEIRMIDAKGKRTTYPVPIQPTESGSARRSSPTESGSARRSSPTESGSARRSSPTESETT